MQPDFCWWCDTPVKVHPPHDYKATRVFCSRHCMISDWMFNQLYEKGVVYETNKGATDGEEEA